MRKMSLKEMNRMYHLREHGRSKKVRKKNHHRAQKYLNRFGAIPYDYEKYIYEVTYGLEKGINI